MKLTNKALEAINNSPVRMRLGLALGVNEATIRTYIKDNEVDGDLTKVTALRIIEEETGLIQSKILVEEKTSA